MITVDKIIEWSKPHQINGGKMTRLHNDKLEVSIVGGASGLYGDFKKDFEVAIIDKERDEFVTSFFYPEGNDDVIGYMDGEDMVSLINKILGKGFQVR